MSTATGFDFEGVDAFQASPDTILPKGNYVAKITDIEAAVASTKKPMILVKAECQYGSIRDWLVITDAEFSRRKVAGLFLSAGVQIKNDMFTGEGHAKQAVLNEHLLGKEVGVIVREEEDDRPDHVGEWRPKVQGYTSPDRIPNPGPTVDPNAALTPPGAKTGDVPIDTSGLPGGTPDIPF